jgi:hypothetical protein
MRVRLPNGRVLKGQDLERFQTERARIDELLRDENAKGALKVASASK